MSLRIALAALLELQDGASEAEIIGAVRRLQDEMEAQRTLAEAGTAALRMVSQAQVYGWFSAPRPADVLEREARLSANN